MLHACGAQPLAGQLALRWLFGALRLQLGDAGVTRPKGRGLFGELRDDGGTFDLGYPWAVLLMIISAILPCWYFRRKGWL